MSILYDSPVKNSIILYLIISIGILYIKPNFLFKENTGQLKEFGFSDDKTILSYPIFIYIIAILITFYFEFDYLKNINY